MEKPNNTIEYPPRKELLKQAILWEYGSDHPLEEISEITGYPVGSSNFYNSIRWVDDELSVYGKKLENIRGKSYRIVMPDEHIRMSNVKVKQAKTFAKRGLIISASANRKAMDGESRKRTDEHSMGLSRLVSIMESESKPLHELEQQQAARQIRTEKPKLSLGE